MRLDDLAADVLLAAPNCPRFAVVRALRDAAIELCVKTDIWTSEVEDLIVVPGVSEYDLTAPTGAVVNHVMDVLRTVGTVRYRLAKVTQQRILGVAGTGIPSAYAQTDSDTLLLAPAPETAETLKVLFSLRPSKTTENIPDAVAKENTEALVYGAAYRLLQQPGTSWYNPGLSAEFYRKWKSCLGMVMRKVKFGYSGAPLTVETPRFG